MPDKATNCPPSAESQRHHRRHPRHTPAADFPAGAYARASAQLAVPLNLSFAVAPPVFTAILISSGPQAARWLAFVISIFAFCALLGLVLLRHRMNHTQLD